jgi:hypothetical protein
MDAAAAVSPESWKDRVKSPRTYARIAVAAAVGLAAAAGIRAAVLKPRERTERMRAQAAQDVVRLYALQLAYWRAHRGYANDLDSLLASAPDGPALKARLAENTDLGTMAVVGGAQKFKIEINVRDSERTLIRIAGPPLLPPSAGTAGPAPAPAFDVGGNPIGADGAPVAPAR